MSEYKHGPKAIGYAGRRSEKIIAKDVGGQQTMASGALASDKGDIKLEDVLMEAKSTTSRSMTLQFDWLAKIANEARGVGKEPALTVTFTRPDGKAHLDGAWVMVPLYVWKELRDRE